MEFKLGHQLYSQERTLEINMFDTFIKRRKNDEEVFL